MVVTVVVAVVVVVERAGVIASDQVSSDSEPDHNVGVEGAGEIRAGPDSRDEPISALTDDMFRLHGFIRWIS